MKKIEHKNIENKANIGKQKKKSHLKEARVPVIAKD